MNTEHLLSSLNEQQRKAVSSPLENMLVLAGAGSGKTRVLVHRIAWLIQVEQVSPYSILAVTFTNKAAAELRGRIEGLLNISTRGMWVGTFHSLAHRLLRLHWQDANLPEHFQILDSDDQHRLIRRVIKALNIDDEQWAPKKIQWFINGKKDEGLRPQHIEHHQDIYIKTQLRIYEAYEEACQRAGLVDFAELLLRAHELWRDNPSILNHYRERFKHILVDEFQDTNTIQYAWIKILAADNARVMMVGDDDQSIYGWRGAKIENIQRCREDFENMQTICLEQNYRSSGTILQAANAVISNNEDRIGKNLWTAGNQGDPVYIYSAINELDEARFVVERIQSIVCESLVHSDIAILYRSNAQSRVLEEALLQLGIPYRVYGGLRFFERAEIKDALAYLRITMNHNDDAAFDRIVNLPTRGIGDRTLDVVRTLARDNEMSLWDAAKQVIIDGSLSTRASNALQGFITLIDGLFEQTKELPLHELSEHVIEQSGLMAHYKKSKGEKAQARVENLQELVVATKQFENREDDDNDMPILAAFLSHAALEAGDNQQEEFQDSVQLMSLHSAKGLEFPVVFITGVEEGLFPHKMSLEEPGRLSEERRLCYVGMTRAKEQLYLTYAEVRRMYWSEEYHRPSRFIREIPEECLQEVRYKRNKPAPRRSQSSSRTRSTAGKSNYKSNLAGDTGFKLGQLVKHDHFGEGVVLNYEGRGSHARLQVTFKRHGTKWLVLSHANLEAV